MLLKPGKYRFAELAEICGTSRTTAEKFPDRYQLEETQVLYNGREVSGVILDHDKIDRIAQDYPRVLKGMQDQNIPSYVTPPQAISNSNDVLLDELRERIKSLEGEKTQIKDNETDLKVENAGLKSEVEGLKNQIETLKTALSEAQKRADAESTRASGLNNQLGNAHTKLQKLPDTRQIEDFMTNMKSAFEKHIEAVEERLKLQQKETVIKVEQPEQESIETSKKGFKIPFTNFWIQAE